MELKYFTKSETNYYNGIEANWNQGWVSITEGGATYATNTNYWCSTHNTVKRVPLFDFNNVKLFVNLMRNEPYNPKQTLDKNLERLAKKYKKEYPNF